MYDVITVGSNTLDVFAKTDSELIKIKTKPNILIGSSFNKTVSFRANSMESNDNKKLSYSEH